MTCLDSLIVHVPRHLDSYHAFFASISVIGHLMFEGNLDAPQRDHRAPRGTPPHLYPQVNPPNLMALRLLGSPSTRDLGVFRDALQRTARKLPPVGWVFPVLRKFYEIVGQLVKAAEVKEGIFRSY